MRSVVISPHEININVGGGILGFIAPCNPHTQNQAHPPTHRTPSTRPTTSELRENKWKKKNKKNNELKVEKLKNWISNVAMWGIFRKRLGAGRLAKSTKMKNYYKTFCGILMSTELDALLLLWKMQKKNKSWKWKYAGMSWVCESFLVHVIFHTNIFSYLN